MLPKRRASLQSDDGHSTKKEDYFINCIFTYIYVSVLYKYKNNLLSLRHILASAVTANTRLSAVPSLLTSVTVRQLPASLLVHAKEQNFI
jgi:hypothetical protein